MTLTRTVNAALLSPALVWSAIGLRDLLQNGFHSYTSLFPIPFKTHTLSLLNMTAFYIVTFLIITPRRPVRNFSIATSLIFLFNALYEFVYAIFYDVTALVVALPLLTGGIVLILVLNRKLHLLTRHKSKIFLAVLLFFCFLAVMITLNQTGFFAQVHLYLSGQTANDPHSPLWFLSKVLCLWMLFPLLKH